MDNCSDLSHAGNCVFFHFLSFLQMKGENKFKLPRVCHYLSQSPQKYAVKSFVLDANHMKFS